MSRPRGSRTFRLPRRSWMAVLPAVALAALTIAKRFDRERSDSAIEPGPGLHRVVRSVDGDTFILAEGKQRVRLIGVNAPESVKPNSPVEPFAIEASRFTKNFLAGGEVRLAFDKERHDKYGRTLAYVWVGDRMLNEELLLAGLARIELQYHYSKAMKERFRRAEAEAKAAGRGIWSRNEPM